MKTEKPAATTGQANGLPDQNQRMSRADAASCLKWMLNGLFCLPMVVFLATYAARFFWLLELLCNFQFLIFCSLVAMVLIFGLSRQWKLTAVAVLMLLLSGWTTFSIYVPVGTPDETTVTDPGRQIRIYSCNVLHSNDDFQALVDSVEQWDPDIIVLMEYTPRWKDHLVLLEAKYPFRELVPRMMGSGIAIYSRLELLDTIVYQLTEDLHDCPMIRTQIRIGEQNINLFAVHTLSPRYPEFLDIRNQQLLELEEILMNFEGEKMVIGDFNATTWSPFLRDFLSRTGLHDSRRGRGLYSTWPSQYWILRIAIDHLFVTDQVIIKNRENADSIGSDHLPIIADLTVHSKK